MNAAVLQFPAKVQRQAKRRINRVEMDARHSWMMEHSRKWETVATDGAKYETDPCVVQLKKLLNKKMGWPELTMERMRHDIAEGRKLIEKRNAVKAWLASLGADLENIKDAEQALFFAFDQVQVRSADTD